MEIIEDLKIDKLKTFLKSRNTQFGDFLLFQEYKKHHYDNEKKLWCYSVSKPIYATYLRCYVVDQTIGFDYLRYMKDCNDDIPMESFWGSHIEWDDYINILGHWKSRPSFKQLLKAYRKEDDRY